jgi:hypothetical protein
MKGSKRFFVLWQGSFPLFLGKNLRRHVKFFFRGNSRQPKEFIRKAPKKFAARAIAGYLVSGTVL